jgi:hypothetical protein
MCKPKHKQGMYITTCPVGIPKGTGHLRGRCQKGRGKRGGNKEWKSGERKEGLRGKKKAEDWLIVGRV